MAILVAIFWFARLERTVFYNTKEIIRLEKSMDDDKKERKERRAEDMALINSTLVEMRADIKQLLRSHGQSSNGRDEG